MTRLTKLKKNISNSKQLDALYVTKEINIRYLTGYHGSDASLVVTMTKAYLITDMRYTEEAEKYFAKQKGIDVCIVSAKTTKFNYLAKITKKHRIQKLGLESLDIDFWTATNIQKALGPKRVVSTLYFVEQLRMIKDDAELRAMRKAAKLDIEVFDFLRKKMRPGVSEIDLKDQAEAKMKQIGGDGPSYPTIIAAAAKASLPHAVSDSAKLKNNNMILIDMGTSFKGYCSDLTRTFVLGRMPKFFKERYNKVLEAQELAISMVRPGIAISDLEKAVRNYFKSFDEEARFCHSLGHGLGLEVHELPWVNAKNDMVLKPNMVITIEPGLYYPGWGGIRIEDDVRVTDKGAEILTKTEKKLEEMIL